MTSPMLVAIERWCKDEGITAFTAAQAAAIIERPVDTVRRWHSDGHVVPSLTHKFGKLTVHLYTPDDIVSLQRMAEETYPGKRTDLEE